MFIKFKDLIITDTGKYRTRNGNTVVITKTKLLMSYPRIDWLPNGEKDNLPFNFQVNSLLMQEGLAYGYYEYKNKSGKIKRDYNYWLVNGSYNFIVTSPRDIVSKIND